MRKVEESSFETIINEKKLIYKNLIRFNKKVIELSSALCSNGYQNT